MNTPTYKEQFDKLTRAYIENRVDPFNDCACFVGNLLNGNEYWGCERTWKISGDILDSLDSTYMSGTEVINKVLEKESNSYYLPDEIIILERTFLKAFSRHGGKRKGKDGWKGEDALFAAFEITLDLLKQIHQSKGEIIDETPVFQKRQLQPA